MFLLCSVDPWCLLFGSPSLDFYYGRFAISFRLILVVVLGLLSRRDSMTVCEGLFLSVILSVGLVGFGIVLC